MHQLGEVVVALLRRGVVVEEEAGEIRVEVLLLLHRSSHATVAA
jgi:hypothetical protein